MKTKAEIVRLARFLLDEQETGWIENNPPNRYGLNNAVEDALTQYELETKCLLVSNTISATAGTSEYSFSLFGDRIFDIRYVAFDERMLEFKSSDELDLIYPKWRFEGSGQPEYWTAWGVRNIKIIKAPSSTENIYIEGFETHDPLDFDSDTDYPPTIQEEDHDLLAYGAALLALIRGMARPEFQTKQASIAQVWEDGLKDAARKVNKLHKANTIFGKNADCSVSDWPNYGSTITNLT